MASDPCIPAESLDLTPDQRDAELAAVARALAHPARVKILRTLAERRECIAGDLVRVVGLAQSTVSQHLAILREAGLVQATEQRPRVCYCADRARLEHFRALVSQL